MGVIKNRKLALKRLKHLIENPSQVLIIHYSQSKTYDEDYGGISPIISAIVIKSLDGNIEQHFAVQFEADKANIPLEEIEDSYRDLEFRMLKSYNDFVKRHNQYIWLHWDMKNIHYGFETIKHRFEKLFSGLRERYEEIPMNNKFNLRTLIEDMYGENFAVGADKLASLMKTNNSGIISNSYLSLESENSEFERKNYLSVLNSLDCKVDFIRKASLLLNEKKLKVVNKNYYAIYVDTINHPTFTLIGWIVGIVGFIIGIIKT